MRSLIVASLIAVVNLSSAQTKSEWTFAGYVDGYFLYDFNRPVTGNNVNGRGFDISHNRARIAIAEVDALLAPTEKRPWGVNVQLYLGKNTDLIHFAEPGGKDKYKLFRQAYVTYAGKDVTVDFGKFDTWIGYEGIDNRSSDEYSRSFNWTYSEPTYETGFRMTGKLNDKLSGALYLVRGWNEVEDGNGSPSIGAALTYAADPKTTITLQNHYGDEGSDKKNDVGSYGGIGFPNPGTSKVHVLDLIVAYQLDPQTKLAFNMDSGTSSSGPNKGNWNGEVIYVRHQINANQAAGFRLERVEDRDGMRAGIPVLLHSITANYDWTVNKNATLRFEARRDFANKAFLNRENGGLSRTRTTFTLAAVLKF